MVKEELNTTDEAAAGGAKTETGFSDFAKENLPLLEEMMKASLFKGKKTSKTHPKMKPYLFGPRNGVEVIDLEETLKFFNQALDFLKEKLAKKGAVLFVGTTPAVKDAVRASAEKLSVPYVTERWLGGTLTNFKTLSKRIAFFKKLKNDKETGRLDKYTKKERVDFDRQIQKMTTMFSGTEQMEVLPEALVVFDVGANLTAIREAKRLKIPVVGILNTDTDPSLVNYPVPANDKSRLSAEWFLGRIEKAAEEGKNLPKENSN